MRLIGLLIVIVIVAFLVYKGAGNFIGTKNQTPQKAVAQIDKTKDFACKQNLKMLNDFVKNYVSANGVDNPSEIDLSDLLEYGLRLPKCPAGGQYVFKDGKFYCTVHSKENGEE